MLRPLRRRRNANFHLKLEWLFLGLTDLVPGVLLKSNLISVINTSFFHHPTFPQLHRKNKRENAESLLKIIIMLKHWKHWENILFKVKFVYVEINNAVFFLLLLTNAWLLQLWHTVSFKQALCHITYASMRGLYSHYLEWVLSETWTYLFGTSIVNNAGRYF